MCVIKETSDRGNGIFAEKTFKIGDVVFIGKVEKELVNNHSHASQVGLDKFILPDPIYRTTNHSCDPNCGIQLNPEGAHNLIAKKDIEAGEEVTFDYAMENFVIESFPAPCKCGSTYCRKHITGWKDLNEIKKAEYRNWAAPYLLIHDLELQID